MYINSNIISYVIVIVLLLPSVRVLRHAIVILLFEYYIDITTYTMISDCSYYLYHST